MSQLWTRRPLFVKCKKGRLYGTEMLYQYHWVLGHDPSDEYMTTLRTMDPERHMPVELYFEENIDGYPLSDGVRQFLAGVCNIEASNLLGITASRLIQVFG